jgi:hypothetical protein
MISIILVFGLVGYITNSMMKINEQMIRIESDVQRIVNQINEAEENKVLYSSDLL